MSRTIQILFFAISTIAGQPLFAEEPLLRVVADAENRPVAVEASGWIKDQLLKLSREDPESIKALSALFRVHVLDDKGNPQFPALGGRSEFHEGAIRFTPQFSFQPGMKYEAFFQWPARALPSTQLFSLKFAIPSPPPTPPTRVTAIYPSAATLPENQLRFYIHFSGAMTTGEAYQHVKLLKANGQEVKRAFLELGEELWDGTGQRLTLLFDPGRVKKGLKPREEFGPVLEPGESYRLVIDKSWKDANGQPLAADFEKEFTAGPAVEAAVDWKEWKIDAPPSGGREPLVIRFPRSLDHALLQRMIGVEGAAGKMIDGAITVTDEERRWQFIPAQPWPAGQLTLVVEKTLEDSAGNNLARPFEVDVFDRVDDKPGPDYVRIPLSTKQK
jgi:hypothetical protein